MTLSPESHPPAAAIVIISGGLDSTTLVYHLRARGSDVRMLSFDYGQRHRRELKCARQIVQHLQLRHQVVDLRPVGALLNGSALTNPGAAVPDGHYTDESMRATVVPNRNALMLDVAVAVAVAIGYDAVAFGTHGGDHVIYPDCRPEFVAVFAVSARLAKDDFLPDGFRMLAPFLGLTKADIVRLRAGCGVRFEHTWSCYRGGERHCGTCGACAERPEAFHLARVPDPTSYEVA